MDETTPENRHNVQRQLAIFEVAKRASGKSITEIRHMLREAFARRRVTGPPGTWLDSVATEASYGKPYIVDLSAAETAATVAPAPGAGIQQSLQQRLRLRMPRRPAGAGRHSAAPGQAGDGTGGSRRHTGSGTGENLAAVRAIVAGAIALTLAAAAVMAIRARRHPAVGPVTAGPVTAGLVTAGRPAP